MRASAAVNHVLTISRCISTQRTPASIESLASVGRLRDAVQSLVLLRFRGEHVRPKSFVCVFKACLDRKNLIEGRRLHAHMVVSGFHHDPFVFNHLINMYGKFGSLGDANSVFKGMPVKNVHSWNTLMACYCKFGWVLEARRLFDEMPKRDLVSWNSMIAGYERLGPYEEALNIFTSMRESEFTADRFNVSSAIGACKSLGFLSNGEELHGLSVKVGLDLNAQVGSALIGLYAKGGEIERAKMVFDQMGIKEMVTWNSMLSGYVHCSKIDEAIYFFGGMEERNLVSWTTIIAGCSQHDRSGEAVCYFGELRACGLEFDQVSLVSALNGCVGSCDFEEGLKIHGLIIKNGLKLDTFVGTALVALYSRCGMFNEANAVIQRMHEIDDFLRTMLIVEYGKHGQMDSAIALFQSVEEKSVALWNSLIAGYCEDGSYEEAVDAFNQMHIAGMKGDEFTLGSLLNCCDVLGLKFGEQLHSRIIKDGVESSIFIGSALINLYSKFLHCEQIERVFGSIHEPNIVVWNALISGYRKKGLNRQVIHMFRLVKASEIKPDFVSFSCVLGVCSTLQYLVTGMQVHVLAYKAGFESGPVVGSAIIDMYGKCGRMDLATIAFSDIHNHSVSSWTALVGGYVKCGMWGTATELFDMIPEKNIFSWNTMLFGHTQFGSGVEAFTFYSKMTKLGVLPDPISFVNLLSVCSNFSLEEPGRQVHTQIIKMGYHINVLVSSALTDMYVKFGKIVDVDVMRSKLGKYSNNMEVELVSLNT
ncbi:Pentatricopeptide repeat-containing protein [Acorus calamus]|uniref:Pentatricopeptide repeat-containing protein n=1 Tax=Acorus calamus TaxID=4465 RepID=A0AAV9EU51_ACOCL|nr:Pentatricopeptide repeat-containing protein [Acorus calamus]